MDELNPYETLRVLVADDSDYMRLLLRTMLRGLGIDAVDFVESAEQAVRYLRRAMPDLLITDLKMPGMSGLDLARHVRRSEGSLNPFLSVLMLTGHAGAAEIEAARDAGVNEFLAKPVSVLALGSRLAEIVQRPRRFVRSPTYFGPDRRRRSAKYQGDDRRVQEAYYTTPEQIELFVEELRSRMSDGPVTRVAESESVGGNPVREATVSG